VGGALGASLGDPLGEGDAGGPDDTMSATSVPTATCRPATGSLRMTAPAGTSGSAARVVELTRRPAVVIAKIASACGAPMTSGTMTSSRAVETVGMTSDPYGTGVPGPGDWLMTVPSG
jgi:hypothetical protein